MRVLALVSGGKDSTYAMMKCVEHGHQIVALGNLYPPARYGEEMDSFMYQTVGHAHVQAIADAMELPLYRQEITGTAVATGLRYDRRIEGDEVEDLHALLSRVRAEHPEVDAVCCGAVLSNYQRARVECVCTRLGLASLAYLWQRDQSELLAEMVGAGVVAIVIKVAALGLGTSHLGRSVGELQPTFHRLHDRFGFHVCGEGGEYETFTLDCPLFRRSVVTHGASVTQTGGDVAMLSFESVTLAPKPGVGETRADEPGADADAGGGDDSGGESSELGEECEEAEAAYGVAADAMWKAVEDEDGAECGDAPVKVVELGGGVAHVAAHGNAVCDGGSAPDQLRGLLCAVKSSLSSLGLGLGDVLFVSLYVADMAQYADLNTEYSGAFAEEAPAARAAVQLPLRGGCGVSVECVAWRGEKQLLHVQSLSEWAPRMIGPYCQMSVGLGVGRVAGSIGLLPPTMQLTDGIEAQARLALDNSAAVLEGMGHSSAGTISLTVYVADATHAAVAQRVASRWLRRALGESVSSSPPLLLVEVSGLPMNALVEAQVEAHSPSAPPLCRAQLRGPSPRDSSCAASRVDVVIGGAVQPPSADAESPRGLVAHGCALCALSAAAGARVALSEIGRAAAVAFERVEEHLATLAPPPCMGRTTYARVYFDARVGADGVKVAAAIESAAQAARRECVALALPTGQLRYAGAVVGAVLQLHFVVSLPHEED